MSRPYKPLGKILDAKLGAQTSRRSGSYQVNGIIDKDTYKKIIILSTRARLTVSEYLREYVFPFFLAAKEAEIEAALEEDRKFWAEQQRLEIERRRQSEEAAKKAQSEEAAKKAQSEEARELYLEVEEKMAALKRMFEEE